jgi:hypothetical protein
MTAKINAFLLTSFGDNVRELQVKGGEELSPALRFGDASAFMPSPSGMISVLDRAFKGEL